MTRPLSILGLVISLAAVTIVAALGGFASAQAAGFYRELVRPSWAPPGWLFGPVWTFLYVLMGVAAWRVWRSGPFAQTRRALALHGVQLVLNALWSWIFFAWQEGLWAGIEIVVLWGCILATVLAFRCHDALAAWLMVPYLLWVSFATVLTWAMTYLNPLVL